MIQVLVNIVNYFMMFIYNSYWEDTDYQRQKQNKPEDCGRLNNGPQKCPHPHPATCEHVTLHGKLQM